MPFVETTPDFWDKILAINLKGPIACTHAVLPSMIEQSYGKIVTIASDAGRVGSTGEAVYSAAKGGLIAFTKTIARETARHRINVNCVCPGPSDTPLFQNEFAAASPKLAESLKRVIPWGRLGVARRHRAGRRLSRLRRGRLHHRPDAERVRRPHHGVGGATITAHLLVGSLLPATWRPRSVDARRLASAPFSSSGTYECTGFRRDRPRHARSLRR